MKNKVFLNSLPADLKPYRKHIERLSAKLGKHELTGLQVQQLSMLKREGCLLMDDEFDERVAKGLSVDRVM